MKKDIQTKKKFIDNKDEFVFGKWVFLLGLIISIPAGILGLPKLFAIILFCMGLMAGFLKIKKEDMNQYLIAILVLLLASSSLLRLLEIMNFVFLGALKYIFINFNAFLAASGIIMAIRSVFMLGDKK